MISSKLSLLEILSRHLVFLNFRPLKLRMIFSFIEVFVPEYSVTGFFELYVGRNEVAGYAFDMFEIIEQNTD